MLALGLFWGIVHQCQAPFKGSQPPGDGVGHIGQAFDGGNQHQHGGDEGHKTTHGRARGRISALHQGDHQHQRQCDGGHDLGQWRHGGRGHGGFECQLSQPLAQGIESSNLLGLRTVQSHHAVGQHVFFHHIGQVVGRLLAFFGQTIKPTRQHFHDPTQTGRHRENHQGQLPIEPHQIAHQSQQGETIAGQADQSRHQLGGAHLHLVHHRVGQGAGRLTAEKRQIRPHQLGKKIAAQFFHAVIGDAGQGILRHKVSQTTHSEQSNDRQRNRPQRQFVLGKSVVQQRLKQGRDQGFGERRHQGGPHGQSPNPLLTDKIGLQSQQPLANAGLDDGRSGRRCG